MKQPCYTRENHFSSTLMDTSTNPSPVGKLFLLNDERELATCFADHLVRPLQLGDVVLCLREFPTLKGVYEYAVLSLRCAETVFVIKGNHTANDRMGQELPCRLTSAQTESLMHSQTVPCDVYKHVASFLLSLSPELYAQRLRALRPGAVLFGQDDQGQDLVPGGVAVVLNVSTSADPMVTLHAVCDNKPARLRRRLSSLLQAKLANDPGLREQAPALQGLWVQGHHPKGTVLGLRYPFPVKSSAFTTGQGYYSNHAIVTKPINSKRELELMLFDHYGTAVKAKVAAASLMDATPMH